MIMFIANWAKLLISWSPPAIHRRVCVWWKRSGHPSLLFSPILPPSYHSINSKFTSNLHTLHIYILTTKVLLYCSQIPSYKPCVRKCPVYPLFCSNLHICVWGPEGGQFMSSKNLSDLKGLLYVIVEGDIFTVLSTFNSFYHSV